MDSICPICGIQIQGYNSNFKRHVQSHGDLPYKCHVCDKSFARSIELTDLQSSLIRLEQVIIAKEQEQDVVIGPHEQILNESLKELKRSTERYFAGDAMTGNKECNAYK